jgi:hypothetical protein
MKNLVIVASMATLICCSICSGVGIVKNGSFENDGYIEYITQDDNDRPEYWCDVSYDQSKFAAYLDNYWKTNGSYSLLMYSYSTIFGPNDAAEISQSVYLADTNQLDFDLALYTDYGAWDVNVATARVLIDNNEVWNSDGLQFTAGQFEGEIAVELNPNLKDENVHIFTLQIRIDVGRYNIAQYYSQWDNIRFSYSCRLPGDLTGDCVVDINDLNALADGWLSPAGPDLTGDGASNFADFAVLADNWQTTGDSNTSVPSQSDLLDADLDDDGIVDFSDVIVLCGDWLAEGGPCVRADLKQDGVIDFFDFVKLAEKWQQTGSLYGW